MILGLCLGFMWGTGCSLAILYSIYLGGYRKAVEESLAPVKSQRFRKALARVEAKLEARRKTETSAEQSSRISS
jgi:hypothetical protein